VQICPDFNELVVNFAPGVVQILNKGGVNSNP
jgi:hypothetical protein